MLLHVKIAIEEDCYIQPASWCYLDLFSSPEIYGLYYSEGQADTLVNSSTDAAKYNKRRLTKAEQNLVGGTWEMVNIPDINISFYDDRTFVFNDWDKVVYDPEVLHGTFKLHGNKLRLKYTYGDVQTFTYKKRGEGDVTDYHITKKGERYDFVKVRDINN